MARPRVNISVYFHDADSQEYFLFQILNFGKDEDELKFIFNHSRSGTGGLYFESNDEFTGSELVRLQPEVTYHNDGTLHWKLPSYSNRTTREYKNPRDGRYRRSPLGDIQRWSPIIRYTVVNYSLCKKPSPTNPIFLPQNSTLFSGTPFECMIFLGNKANPTPIAKPTECVHRVGIANNIDLLVCIYKSKYKGRKIRIGNTNHSVFTKHNVVEIVEWKR